MNTNTTNRVRHPISGVLRREGLTLIWLHRQTRFHRTYLSRVFNGFEPATATVRARCAAALGMDERDLFLVDGAHDDDSDGTRAGLSVVTQ